jgi:hypothetical protein
MANEPVRQELTLDAQKAIAELKRFKGELSFANAEN